MLYVLIIPLYLVLALEGLALLAWAVDHRLGHGHPVWSWVAAIAMLLALALSLMISSRRSSRIQLLWIPLALGIVASVSFAFSAPPSAWIKDDGRWHLNGMPVYRALLEVTLLPNGMLMLASALLFKARHPRPLPTTLQTS
jgi:hypothetical protein